MISIGPEKLLFVFFVAALVLGPDKMPGTARKVGRVVSELRRMADGLDPRSVLDHIGEQHMADCDRDRDLRGGCAASQPDDGSLAGSRPLASADREERRAH